jgi:hypothetical protein
MASASTSNSGSPAAMLTCRSNPCCASGHGGSHRAAHRLARQPEARDAALHLGELEHVVQQPREPLGFVDDRVEVFLRDARIRRASHAQCFREHANRRQRRF